VGAYTHKQATQLAPSYAASSVNRHLQDSLHGAPLSLKILSPRSASLHEASLSTKPLSPRSLSLRESSLSAKSLSTDHLSPRRDTLLEVDLLGAPSSSAILLLLSLSFSSSRSDPMHTFKNNMSVGASARRSAIANRASAHGFLAINRESFLKVQKSPRKV
jgi:hypothetical protein